MDYFKKACELEPDSVDRYMELGNAQYFAGQYAESVESLNTAINNIGTAAYRVLPVSPRRRFRSGLPFVPLPNAPCTWQRVCLTMCRCRILRWRI